MDSGLRGVIAKAIKEADKSYFWEDYSKQASSVMKALYFAGYVIVPETPSVKMVKSGVDSVMIGRTQPQELAKQIYTAMIRSK